MFNHRPGHVKARCSFYINNTSSHICGIADLSTGLDSCGRFVGFREDEGIMEFSLRYQGKMLRMSIGCQGKI